LAQGAWKLIKRDQLVADQVVVTFTFRMWQVAVVGVAAALATGLLVGSMFFRSTKTVVIVPNASPAQVMPVDVAPNQAKLDLAQAKRDVRNAIPSVEAYYSDHDPHPYSNPSDGRGYRGMTEQILRNRYDRGISRNFVVITATAKSYCVEAVFGGLTPSRPSQYAHVIGPGGHAVEGPCPGSTAYMP